MTYTPYADVVASQSITAAYMNTYWQDNPEALHSERPRARVYYDDDQQMLGSTANKPLFNQERYDVGGLHSVVSNTERFTIPADEAGDYRISFCGEWSTTPATYEVYFIVNNTTIIAWFTGTQKRFSLSTEYRLAVGDYVEVVINPASTQTLLSTSAYSPEFMISWINAT